MTRSPWCEVTMRTCKNPAPLGTQTWRSSPPIAVAVVAVALISCVSVLLASCDSAEDSVLEGLTGKIVFTSGTGTGFSEDDHIFIMNADGSELTRLTSRGRNEYPDLSPGKSKIVFRSFRTAEQSGIFVIDSDGTGERLILGPPGPVFGAPWTQPDWSPDGSKITVTWNGSGPIHIMNADGTGLTRITDIWVSGSAWSPDGSKIAFWGSEAGSFEIFVVNVDGSGLTNLTKSSANETGPAWSPDGSKIAYSRNESDRGPVNVFVMNADGTNQTRLTDVETAGPPTWSPDGSKIAFADFSSNRLFVMNADGTGVTRIRVTAKVYSPDWR